MDHPTDQRDGQTDPLTPAAPAQRRTRHLRGALAATTSAGLLFGAGTAMAGASTTSPGTNHAAHFRAAFRHDHARNAGKVTSVDGTNTTGACGTAGGSGSFVLTRFKGTTRTYDVDPSTTFVEPGVTAAGFNNLCVGDVVAVRTAHRNDQDSSGAPGDTGASASTGASGDSGGTGNTGAGSSGAVTARKVFIAPATPPVTPSPVPPAATTPTTPAPTPGAAGFAPSPTAEPKPLSGASPGARPGPTAGAADLRGIVSTKDPSSFDVNTDGQPRVVDVTATTTYVGPGGPTTYGAVAVGDAVRVSGTDVNGTFTATTVDVFGAPSSSNPGPQPGPSPVPSSSGFGGGPAPTPVAPSAPGPQGSGGSGHGESPQGQGFSNEGAAAGGRSGFGR